MADNNIWGMVSKKKSSNTLTIPAKKTTSNNTPTANNTVQTKTVTAPKVKAHKVKAHKVQQHIHQPQQQPQYNLSDFNVSTTGDQNAIYITILYNGHPIYKFTLPKQDFGTWQYRMDSNQRLQYVTVRIHANGNAFNNDMRIIQPVILAIYQILTNIFAEAQRMKAQQAHKRMI